MSVPVHPAESRADRAPPADLLARAPWRPQVVYVHDFALPASAGACGGGTGGQAATAGNRIAANSSGEHADRAGMSRIACAVTVRLADEIGRRGLAAVAMSPTARTDRPGLAVEGQYLSIGADGVGRAGAIGGGAIVVRTLVQVYETSDSGRALVEDFYVSVPMFSGRGAPASAAAEDAGRAARAIADVLAGFFDQQRWLAPR